MYINPIDVTVYMEFNWWVDQLFVGLQNRPVLKSIWNVIEYKKSLLLYRSIIVEHYSGFISVELTWSYLYKVTSTSTCDA